MNIWLLFIPFIAAFTGWFVIWMAIKILLKPGNAKPSQSLSNQANQAAEKIAGLISREIISADEIDKKISDPAAFQKLTPLIDTQIDNFLKVKLPQTMPYITAFIGDKTIIQLKAVFMEELQTLFPELMKNYVQQLQQQHNIEKIIANKLASLPAGKIENIFTETFSKELTKVKFLGALLGFGIGTVYFIITLIA